jgi:hypothetical protein
LILPSPPSKAPLRERIGEISLETWSPRTRMLEFWGQKIIINGFYIAKGETNPSYLGPTLLWGETSP